MKRLILTLSLLVTVIAGALAQNDAMYIYRNDGTFNAFLKNDVDSVAYSHYDADGVYCNDWMTQIVYTPDSVYRIPLAAIDSVVFANSFRTCPDGNHPHAIDLGLPSGTKWCCCNVGASTPEGYGGYYAWGETSEKSVYNWETYAYSDEDGNCVNIGSDISGTQYDVAHVRMGTPWRMPTHEQQMELVEHCTQVWTQQNGVNGILVTGSSGGQVFLPAAGGRVYGNLYYAGSYGYYWSSSLDPDNDDGAYGLYFGSGYWSWSYYNRSNGQSVRPVCP